MQRRPVLATIVALLLAVTLAAAYALWTIERRAEDVDAAERALSARLDNAGDLAEGIAAAQQGYVAPGQLDEPWFERASKLFVLLEEEIAGVGTLLRTPAGSTAHRRLADSVAALANADQRIRDNLGQGQDLMAADVLFSDGRSILERISTQLRELRAAEREQARAEQATLANARWAVLGVLAFLWVGGVVGLLSAPARTIEVAAPLPDVVPDPAPPVAESRLDLAATAELCTDLSRVTDTAALSELLARASALVGASGVTVWLGAGDQLFAATGHGYSHETLARLGPVRRSDDNALARVWRTGHPTTLGEAPPDGGAVIVPLLTPAGCIGVLAFEMRLGNLADDSACAVARLVAAQLATVVPAWPTGADRPLPGGIAARPA